MPDAAAEPDASHNLLIDFYHHLPALTGQCLAYLPPGSDTGFSPGHDLPDLDADMRTYLAAATVTWRHTGSYQDHPVSLLDLGQNPRTQTTKTFASLLIVARAVEHIRRTGEAVMIVSPTSANKGVALRDAVGRALDAGLVSADMLRILIVAPAGSSHKLRTDRLSDLPDRRALNPLLLCDAADPEAVKALTRAFVTEHAPRLQAHRKLHLWYSLDLSNYIVADATRALFEHQVAPVDADARPRVHAHAVSSAFGLIGYHAGRAVLEESGRSAAARRPGTLLVQHLATPDMVLALRSHLRRPTVAPAYRQDPATGLFHQGGDPGFPTDTFNPHEVIDETFYTRRPATGPLINAIIARHGGDGIVVSLRECLDRYPFLHRYARLPRDPRRLAEWSTVMAFTGVLNAIDRGLIAPHTHVVVHGTGSYTRDDFRPIDASAVPTVSTPDDIAHHLAT
jgi:hypothetical protein